MTFQPSEHGLSLTHFASPASVSRCFAFLPAGNWRTEGVLLSGSVDATNEQLRQAQEGTDHSFRALIAKARINGAGRCTLRRVR